MVGMVGRCDDGTTKALEPKYRDKKTDSKKESRVTVRTISISQVLVVPPHTPPVYIYSLFDHILCRQIM